MENNREGCWSACESKKWVGEINSCTRIEISTL